MAAKKGNGKTSLPSGVESYEALDESILKLESPGDYVHGLLVDIETRELLDKKQTPPVMRGVLHYIFESVNTPGIDDGATVIIRGTTDIAKKLDHRSVGCLVYVARTAETFQGADKSKNAMVVYDVRRGPKGDPAAVARYQRDAAVGDALSNL